MHHSTRCPKHAALSAAHCSTRHNYTGVVGQLIKARGAVGPVAVAAAAVALAAAPVALAAAAFSVATASVAVAAAAFSVAAAAVAVAAATLAQAPVRVPD